MKKNLYYKTDNKGNVNFIDRWKDLEKILDLETNDSVLDIGCAEGLISLEVAKKVKTVIGFDIEPYRIEIAKYNAKQQNIKNINFLIDNYRTFNYTTYDKILCLGVYHKIKNVLRLETLKKIFDCCKKQIYIRVPIIDNNSIFKNVGVEDKEILNTAKNKGFSLLYRSVPRDDHGTIFKFQKTINTV